MGAAGALDPFVHAREKYGGGGQGLPVSGEVTSKALRRAEDEEKPCLQKRCLIGPGIRPQYRSWGDIFKERRLRIQASESFILCFLALFFSGLFFNHPVSSFYTEPLPWLPPTPHHCQGELRPRDTEGRAPRADDVSSSLGPLP